MNFPTCRTWLLILAACLSAGCCSAGEAEPLDGSDEVALIRRMLELADSAKIDAGLEEKVANLMTEDRRGRRLAPWCLFTLTKISAQPEKYLPRFFKAAQYIHLTVVEPGKPGRIDFDKPDDTPDPILPHELETRLAAAWDACVPLAFKTIRTGDEETSYLAIRCISEWSAPLPLVVPAVMALVSDPKVDEKRRYKAKFLLWGRMQTAEMLEPLLTALKSPDANIRKVAVDALGLMPWSEPSVRAHPRAAQGIDILIDAAQHDADVAVRVSALNGLRNFYFGDRLPPYPGTDKIAAAYGAMLSDAELRVRTSAANNLSQIGKHAEPQTAEMIARFKAERDAEVRDALVGALGMAGGPDGFDTLVAALSDPEKRVRARASCYVGSLAQRILKDAPEKQEALAKVAVDPLAAMVAQPEGQHIDIGTLGWASKSLGYFGLAAKKAVPDIRRWLGRASVQEQPNFIAGLGGIGDPAPGLLDEMFAYCKSEDRYVKCAAVEALGTLGRKNADALALLLKLAEDEDDAVKTSAVIALGESGEDTSQIRTLLRAIASVDRGEWSTVRAKEALKKMNARRKPGDDF